MGTKHGLAAPATHTTVSGLSSVDTIRGPRRQSSRLLPSADPMRDTAAGGVTSSTASTAVFTIILDVWTEPPDVSRRKTVSWE